MAEKIDKVWRDIQSDIYFRIYAMDPRSLNRVRYEITDKCDRNITITDAHETDTKMSATIIVYDLKFDVTSNIRIIECSPKGKRPIFTGAIKKYNKKKKTGAISLELQSTLWCISEDRVSSPITIASRATARKALTQLCKRVGRPYQFASNFKDRTYTKAVVYDVNDSFLKVIGDICSTSGDSYGVDGYGNYIFKRNVNSTPGASWVLDETDKNTIVIYDDEAEDTDNDSLYNRSIVTHTEKEKLTSGQYNVPTSSKLSSAKLGYTRARVHQMNSMSPNTTKKAQGIARNYSRSDAQLPTKKTITTLWFPVRTGDRITLTNSNRETFRWFVQTVEMKCANRTLQITLVRNVSA